MRDEKALRPAQHEHSDVGTRLILIGAPMLAISVVLLALLVLWLFPKETLDRTLELSLPQFPYPRLQTSARDDMAAFRHAELERLNSAGWTDQAKGVAHIPIAVAIRKIVEDKIPGWPGAAPTPTPRLVVREEAPKVTQVTEKPHGALHSARPAAARAAPSRCWIDAKSNRHCLRAKERSGAAAERRAARR